MLRILESQMGQLAAREQAAFIARTRPLLRERYAERTAAMSDAELTGVIEQGMSAARGYGIERARGVERFLDLMFQLGLDFDRSVGWAHEILNRRDFTGQIRIDVLCAAHEGRIPEDPEEGPFFP